jgi:hypothetical protein
VFFIATLVISRDTEDLSDAADCSGDFAKVARASGRGGAGVAVMVVWHGRELREAVQPLMRNEHSLIDEWAAQEFDSTF